MAGLTRAPRTTNRSTPSRTTSPLTSTRRSAAGRPSHPGSPFNPPPSFLADQGRTSFSRSHRNRPRPGIVKRLEELFVAKDTHLADHTTARPNPCSGRPSLGSFSPRFSVAVHPTESINASFSVRHDRSFFCSKNERNPFSKKPLSTCTGDLQTRRGQCQRRQQKRYEASSRAVIRVNPSPPVDQRSMATSSVSPGVVNPGRQMISRMNRNNRIRRPNYGPDTPSHAGLGPQR